jgi:hypothetical protein
MMAPAADLFRQMCQAKGMFVQSKAEGSPVNQIPSNNVSTFQDLRDLPNVRTLNTLLRGCLWMATSFEYINPELSRRLVGGLATSDETWDLCKSLRNRSTILLPDLSSYEYYITQLCYALRVDDANLLIRELKQRFGLSRKDDRKKADASSLDTLTIVLTAQARAYAMLGKENQAAKFAKEALGAVDLAKQQKQQDGSSAAVAGGKFVNPDRRRLAYFLMRLIFCFAGKRAWREERKGQRDSSNQKSRRANSNAIFRAHRLSEVEREVGYIAELSRHKSILPQSQDLVLCLSSRIMHISGGGTTVVSSRVDTLEKEVETLRLLNNHAAALFHSFGLKSALQDTPLASMNTTNADCWTLLGSTGKATEISSELKHLLHIRKALKLSTQINAMFSLPFDDSQKPLHVELGSGSGDWIVSQASLNPRGNYVAVELRSDRCAQTFSKIMLSPTGSPLYNICCVESDCGIYLERFQTTQQVSRMYVNHPEPPTQTYGSSQSVLKNIAQGGTEPAHMLASDTLRSALQCLAPQGQLVIVSDNLFYARLICATLVKVLNRGKHQLGCNSLQSLGAKYRQLETYRPDSNETSNKCIVRLFEGQPSEVIGHYLPKGGKGTSGSSYFDRLWKAGAGKHADKRSRYIIVIQRSE